MTFAVGDTVAIIPHRSRNDDNTVKDVIGTVVNPHDPTDMRRLNGDPVGFYVRVRIGSNPAVHGYHEASLERVNA